jgi:Lar family restriction alleviation protein
MIIQTEAISVVMEKGKKMAELLPCPFCGGEAVVIAQDFDDGDVWYRPECTKCKCGWRENVETIDEAIEKWNARTKERGGEK